MSDNETSKLRLEAEKRKGEFPENEELSDMDSKKLLHELQVHQIELEVQNEELNVSLAHQQELAQKYNELFHLAPIGYFALDRNGNIKELNLAGAQMLGFTMQYLAGKPFIKFIQPVHTNLFKVFFSRVLLVGEKQRCEVSLISEEKVGLTVYIEGIRSIGDSGCLISTVDISEIKEAKENLQKTNAKLAETLSLKEKLLSIIGHDLRAPITNILLFFNMLQEEYPDIKERDFGKFFNEIIFNTEHALILLENLIAWSKLRTGSIESKIVKMPIRPVVNDVFEIFASAASKKDISLLNLVDGALEVNINEFLIKTLLRNLITNGIKFSKPGGQVSVEAMDNGRRIEFIITDKGTGMSEENIKKILAGEKINSTFGTANEPGSGFGLILIKELIHMYNGEIWIISRKEQGTIVHFTLPCQ